MTRTAKKYLAFVIYGNDKTYYQGARFCILSFLANWQGDESSRPEVVVLAEETEHFSELPIHLFPINTEQKREWSLDNTYHFRIKNRGLKYIGEQLELEAEDKLLFLDTDTYFEQTTNIYFDSISAEQSLMFFPEVEINSLPDTNEYAVIRGKTFELEDGSNYSVNDESTMWASAVIGFTGTQLKAFDYADQLIKALRNGGCKAHTLEQFALSEALSREVTLVPSKDWLKHYSTSGRKDWGRKVLDSFFASHGNKPFEEQIKLAKDVSFTRPLSEVIRGHIYKKKKKLRKLFGLKEE
jgi:heptosyltransferase-3